MVTFVAPTIKIGIILSRMVLICFGLINNRLRITAKGDLRLCLFGNTGINIRHLMQRDNQTEELKDLILKQLNYKKESHYLEIGETGLTKNLSTTGG